MAVIAAVASGAAQGYKAMQGIKLKKQEAEAFRDARNRSMAGTTLEMQEQERKKELMHSRAVALAAASGGGVDDPGMVKILGDLNAEGEYNIMASLWTGQDRAAGLQFRSEAATREAEAGYTAGVINVISSAASAYSGAGGGKGSFGGVSTVKPTHDFSGREIQYS